VANIDPATGDRLINVPGKGQVTETQFRSMVQNNEISAGPGGSAAQRAIDSGSYSDPYAGGQNGSQNTSTPYASTQSGGGSSSTASGSNGTAPGTNGSAAAQAANNMGAANPGTNFGGILGSGNADSRTENVYALRNNDDPVSWAKRVFAQGTADNGQAALNPYLDQNPLANSPYARWYQDRYGVAAPTNALVAAELGNQSPTSTYTSDQMKSMQGNGQFGPGNMADATSNLRGLQGMLQNYAGGGKGLSTTQNLFAGQLMNDPQLSSQAVTSQLQGATGGWGMGYLTNALSNLATHYYNDPSQQGPQSPKGSFLKQALQMIGMG
jgi:hypothetical protein